MDTHQLAGLAIALAYSLVLVTISVSARFNTACILSLLGAAFYYRREIIGFLLVSAVAYLLAVWISRQRVQGRRWQIACFLIISLVVMFTCGRVWHWDRLWSFPLIGPVALYSLGMWPALKLLTLFWELGSGSVMRPTLSQYVLWTCLPFTLGGPILRWSEMPGVLLANPAVFRSGSWWMAVLTASAKMAAGILLGPGQSRLADYWHSHLGVNAVSIFVTGPLGFYLSAAGYFQWMQLLGMSCGVKVPESFNYPIGRENISA